jgi:hypothetical protein
MARVIEPSKYRIELADTDRLVEIVSYEEGRELGVYVEYDNEYGRAVSCEVSFPKEDLLRFLDAAIGKFEPVGQEGEDRG